MENVNDLPVEVLTRIFDYLDVGDRKHAAFVCTLWHRILLSTQFQRQCRIALDGHFKEQFTELEKSVLRICRNFELNFWDEDYEEDYDEEYDDENKNGEQQEKEDVISLEYFFNPSPHSNVIDLLFGHGVNLENVELRSTLANCRKIIQDRLPQLGNLKELTITADYLQDPEVVDPNVWTIHHNRIEVLRIHSSYDINPFRIIMPNLTTLDLKPVSMCPWIPEIIRTYKHQLQSLTIHFDCEEAINTVMLMDFPCLAYLNVNMPNDQEHLIRYARTRNRSVDEGINEQFIKGMPKLKTLVLSSHLVFYRIAKMLPTFAHQLEEISLEDQLIYYEMLKIWERIPKLRCLTMRYCVIYTPKNIHPICLPYLQDLKLIVHCLSALHIVFNEGFVGLKSLTLCVSTQDNHEVLYKICKYLTNLEHLVVESTLGNTALRHLHRLTKLKTLKFTFMEPTVQQWSYCRVIPSIQRLTFNHCTFDKTSLWPIIDLFPSLKELYLDRCTFVHWNNNNVRDSGDEDYKIREKFRSMLPLCRVSIKYSSYPSQPKPDGLSWAVCENRPHIISTSKCSEAKRFRSIVSLLLVKNRVLLFYCALFAKPTSGSIDKFGAQSKMPTDKDIFAFFRKRLWLPEMLHAMFREPRDCSVYVKFQTEEIMTTELLKCPKTDEFHYSNGDSVSVTFAAAKGNFKYVRLFGIPIELEDSPVLNVISKFGKVHNLVREKYGVDTGYPILNGVRGVYLEVSKLIPAQLHIQNFPVRVSYEGMERKCFSCGNVDHVKQDCPKRVSANNRLNFARYSAVLSDGRSSGDQIKLSTIPYEVKAVSSEFPPLGEQSRISTNPKKYSVTQQQLSGLEPSPKKQQNPGVISLVKQGQSPSFQSELSAKVQESSGQVNMHNEAIESVDQRGTARKREHGEEDSDATSGGSGSVECPQQQEAGIITFKVPGVNNLLEKQVKATKLRTKCKQSKKQMRKETTC